MRKSTAIIIPCYNEENRLKVTSFINFITQNQDYHLCFVNDGSKDQTITKLLEIKSSAPEHVTVIDLNVNVGKAEAVRSGALQLAQDDRIDLIGFIDADLSTDFQDFCALAETLRTHTHLDLVYGSRNSNKDQNVERNLFRNLFSKIIKAIIYLILGLPIDDTQCGAKVFRKEIVGISFGSKFLTRWLFDVEIFIKLKNYYGRRNIMNHIYEQPLQKWIHVDDSKLGIKDAIQIPYRLIAIWFTYNFVGQTSL